MISGRETRLAEAAAPGGRYPAGPAGGADSVSAAVAEAVRVVRESGLPSRTDAMFTTIEGDWTGMANLITDEMVDTFAVTGTYATIGRKIQERYAGLLDRTSLYQPYQPGLDDPHLPRLIKEFNG